MKNEIDALVKDAAVRTGTAHPVMHSRVSAVPFRKSEPGGEGIHMPSPATGGSPGATGGCEGRTIAMTWRVPVCGKSRIGLGRDQASETAAGSIPGRSEKNRLP